MLSVKKLFMVVLSLVLSIDAALSISLIEEENHINRFHYGDSFMYMNFKNAASNLSFGNGVADITPNRLLRLTNNTHQIGHAFHSRPLRFKNNTKQNSSAETNNTSSSTGSGGRVLSFSTSFIFSIIKENPKASDSGLSGQGVAFVLAPQPGLPGAMGNGYLGLFNSSNNGNSTNHVLAVELDTVYNREFDTVKGDHVGININGIRSVNSSPAGYYTDSNGGFRSLGLTSENRIQVWIEYDGVEMKLSVTLAPITVPKPDIPLLSYNHDLSDVILDSMYAGFSASTGSVAISYYILGWSFMTNERQTDDQYAKLFGVELPIIIPILLLTFLIGILLVVAKIRSEKFADVVEDWELNYGRLRFSYKDLYVATKGFKEKELLGFGGFGRVYKGILPTSNTKIAVKRISHNSKQGMREFISEIISIGHLRQRNLAHLLGYCRRNTELLLVYDYMPNGSLDKLIFRHSDSTSTSPVLGWDQRFQIIKGVACGLTYLHEEWEQVVIHRDIKAGNVLLDGEMNARLGDFGLARLYNRGTNFRTTKVVGTLGYIAPETSRTGRATTCSDVFSFGALLLEVACGRRPVELNKSETEEGEVLVDWVLSCWRRGAILETTDPNLLNEYVKEEMEMVLKLGLLCSRIDPKARPSMRQVMQYLEGDLPLPETDLWALDQQGTLLTSTSTGECRSCGEMPVSNTFSRSSSALGSVLSGPR